jgi:uncharacterized protein YqfB (UPF0267 family)
MIESNGTDCGIDGDENAPVTHKEHNRFIARILVGHIRPMHARLDDLTKWHADKDDLISQIKGGIIALKFIGSIVLVAITATFGATIWIMSEMWKLMPG